MAYPRDWVGGEQVLHSDERTLKSLQVHFLVLIDCKRLLHGIHDPVSSVLNLQPVQLP